MSRLLKYKESINKFIKERSLIADKYENTNQELNKYIYELRDTDLLLSIIFLTIMNSQNKKNNILLQGYYGASCIEFLKIIINLIDNKQKFINKYDINIYYKIINYLSICSIYTINQNIESIKSSISKEKLADIFLNINEVYNNSVNYNNILSEINIIYSDEKPNNNLIKWYIKDNILLKNKFIKIKKIKKEIYMEYLNKKIIKLSELTFSIAWILGCGNIDDLNKIKKLGTHFGYIYKLTIDFNTLEDELLNLDNEYSLNYIINYGLQEAYEEFMNHKQKFIEDAMMLDVYSITIKELLSYIENRVDIIIDQTSPDIRSTYSSMKKIN